MSNCNHINKLWRKCLLLIYRKICTAEREDPTTPVSMLHPLNPAVVFNLSAKHQAYYSLCSTVLQWFLDARSILRIGCRKEQNVREEPKASQCKQPHLALRCSGSDLTSSHSLCFGIDSLIDSAATPRSSQSDGDLSSSESTTHDSSASSAASAACRSPSVKFLLRRKAPNLELEGGPPLSGLALDTDAGFGPVGNDTFTAAVLPCSS